MQLVICIVLTCVSVVRACDTSCREQNNDSCDLEGTWRNQVCSTMTLKKQDSTTYKGTFLSGTENTGSELTANVYVHPKTGGVFVINVMWHDETVVTWTGQCYRVKEKNGREKDVLITTWLYTKEATCKTSWKSTNTGQDIFERVNRDDGPNKVGEIDDIDDDDDDD